MQAEQLDQLPAPPPEVRWFAESEDLTLYLEQLLHVVEAQDEGAEDVGVAINPNRRWDTPLYPDASMRVSGAMQQLLAWKKDTNASDRQLQSLMKLLSGWVPAAVRFPRTIYECKTHMETPDLWRVRYHVCLTGNCLFEPIRNTDFHLHANEECPCGHRRFTEVRQGDKTIWKPANVSV